MFSADVLANQGKIPDLFAIFVQTSVVCVLQSVLRFFIDHYVYLAFNLPKLHLQEMLKLHLKLALQELKLALQELLVATQEGVFQNLQVYFHLASILYLIQTLTIQPQQAVLATSSFAHPDIL